MSFALKRVRRAAVRKGKGCFNFLSSSGRLMYLARHGIDYADRNSAQGRTAIRRASAYSLVS